MNYAVTRDLLTKLKGYRLFTEIYLILQEDDPIRAIARMGELDLFKFIHPRIYASEQIYRLLHEIKKVIDWYQLLYLEPPLKRWFLYFTGLGDQLTVEEFTAMCRRLEVSQKYYPSLIKIKVRHQTILKSLLFSPQPPRPSQIYRILSAFSLEQLLYAMAKSNAEEVKKRISHYLTTLRKTEILLTGKDLKSLGYRPGPVFKKIMSNLLEAKLDEEVKTRQDEVDYVKQKFPDTSLRK